MQEMIARCGAKRRDGAECQGWAMENGRCRMHGGTAAVGIAAPAFKHGRRSRYNVAAHLTEAHARHLVDPDYLRLVDEIALVSTRIEELAQLDKRTEDQRAELERLIDLRRKLAETEAKTIKTGHDVLTGEQIALFSRAVLEAVRRHVPERDRLEAIQRDVFSILQATKGAG